MKLPRQNSDLIYCVNVTIPRSSIRCISAPFVARNRLINTNLRVKLFVYLMRYFWETSLRYARADLTVNTLHFPGGVLRRNISDCSLSRSKTPFHLLHRLIGIVELKIRSIARHLGYVFNTIHRFTIWRSEVLRNAEVV